MMMPTVIASAEVSARNASALPAASGATTAIDMIDMVELVVIFRCRLVAKTAYTAMPRMAEYRPACGGTPAICA